VFPGGQAVTIVMYHSISRVGHRLAVNPEAFRRQLEVLSDAYPIVRLEQAGAVLAEPGDVRHVAITFDDAYADFVSHAYPVIEDLATPCTVFVSTGYIGGWNEWRVHLPRMPIMGADQLRDVVASGLVDVGSHGVSHLSLRSLPMSGVRHEAVESRRTLEMLLGRRVTTFAYPFGLLGDYSRITGRVFAEAGYEVGVTTRWGTRNSPSRLLALKRISFAESDTADDVRAKVEGRHDWRVAREWAGFVRRRLAGAGAARAGGGGGSGI
jgi:peptidoglycan/xylan/chitin deacetylase (PgdA/CDA1 family)